ncbi:hypothetical protein [Burkholderia sp. BDU5]|uniref:hypothetical protein n=1 Tax=Burkholderia sp. BDU5 TaxID=1385590 RepID=UPI0012E353D4|nr:hypothetical protein [Burkholderia sp. BDU5]
MARQESQPLPDQGLIPETLTFGALNDGANGKLAIRTILFLARCSFVSRRPRDFMPQVVVRRFDVEASGFSQILRYSMFDSNLPIRRSCFTLHRADGTPYAFFSFRFAIFAQPGAQSRISSPWLPKTLTFGDET